MGLKATAKQELEQLSLRDQEYGHKKIWALLNFRHNIEIPEYGTYYSTNVLDYFSQYW